jgi:carboxyl-terminal processing protease
MPKALEKRLANLEEAKESEWLKVLHDAREHLGKRKTLEEMGDIDLAIQGIFDKLQPGFTHVLQKDIPPLKGDWSHPFGVGLKLQADQKTGLLKVDTPLFGTSAHKAGIRSGDIITEIEYPNIDISGAELKGGKFKVVETKGMTATAVDEILFGPLTTTVKVTFVPMGGKGPKVVELTRESVEQETVSGVQRLVDDSWNFYLDPKAKIASVRLSQLAGRTFLNLHNAMKDLNKIGINGLILDLRFNPGGLYDSAVKISNLFLSDGVIANIKKRDGSMTTFVAKTENGNLSFPIACLVNGKSTGSSELVAACLQDHGRAIIVGERTTGKGEFRTLNLFGQCCAVSLLTAVLVRPNGAYISKYMADGKDTWGVKPNPGFALTLPAKEREQLEQYLEDKLIIRHKGDQPMGPAFKDRQLELAVDYLRKLPKK